MRGGENRLELAQRIGSIPRVCENARVRNAIRQDLLRSQPHEVSHTEGARRGPFPPVAQWAGAVRRRGGSRPPISLPVWEDGREVFC